MKTKIIILVIAIALLVYGFTTHIFPYDYIACGVGGFALTWAILMKED